jgi:hypothetical protein
LTPTIFADLRASVYDFGKSGLRGLALHPNFSSVPYVYVLYTYDGPVGGVAPTWGDACPSAGGDCVVSARLSRLLANGNVMSGAEQSAGLGLVSAVSGPAGRQPRIRSRRTLYASAGDGAGSTFVDFGQASPRSRSAESRWRPANQDLPGPRDPVAPAGRSSGSIQTLASPCRRRPRCSWRPHRRRERREEL